MRSTLEKMNTGVCVRLSLCILSALRVSRSITIGLTSNETDLAVKVDTFCTSDLSNVAFVVIHLNT